MSNFDNRIVKSLEILEGFATLGKNWKRCRTLAKKVSNPMGRHLKNVRHPKGN